MRKVNATFDYGSIEQRILALEGAPKKQLRNIFFGMKYGMGSRKLYDYITSLDAFNDEAKLAADILIFERWQSEYRARIRRENAAIAYAAVEAGIAPPAARSRTYNYQGTITGRFTTNFKEIDRVPKWVSGAVDGRFVWNAPKEPESDMERDRR